MDLDGAISTEVAKPGGALSRAEAW